LLTRYIARGWSEGIGGLAFLGIAVGMISSIAYCIVDSRRYRQMEKKKGSALEPEERLRTVMVGSIVLPIGMFCFAFTNSPSIHWAVSVSSGFGFGFAMVLIYLGITRRVSLVLQFNYLVQN